jgi:hypothetical protein
MAEQHIFESQTYVYDNCPNCGVRHAFPRSLYIKARDEQPKRPGVTTYATIYCPNGHAWHYVSQTEADLLRRERDLLKQQAAQKDDEISGLRSEWNKSEAARAATERKLATHKKRASAGTCPCCRRTFQNMASHMKTAHPDFVTEQGAKVVPIKRTATS